MKKPVAIVISIVITIGIGAGAWWYFTQRGNNTEPVNSGSAITADTTTKAKETTAIDAVDCGLTKGVTEGPYYVSGTAELTNGKLNYDNLDSTAISISGHVYAGADGTTPIKNAKIELWQADDSGSYHPNSNGSVSQYSSSEISLRGYVVTDAEGAYKFTSIYPGYYEGRARHIHVKISADGYKSVTTQLIFQPKSGDGQTYSTDGIAQSLGSCYLMKLDDSVSPETGTFTFRLDEN